MRRALAAIWLCFVLRALFYSAMLPLWEGYDEWAHFSVIRIMAESGHLLVPRTPSVPRDVAASLEIVPVAYGQIDKPPGAITQDEFWRLPAEERTRREGELAALPESWRHQASTGMLIAYEAHHPPLYYWLMLPAMKLLTFASLPAQVMALRWLSVLLASLTIPLLFLIGREVFGENALALGCAAIVAVMPEFAIDIARVANECVSVPLFTLLILAALGLARQGFSYRRAALAGVALGLGLLSKAYFLTALPVMAAVYFVAWRRTTPGPSHNQRRWPVPLGPLVCGVLIPAAIAGFWYARNLATSGTVSGMVEAGVTRGASWGGMLAAALHINWLKVADGILLSHLYFGAWSSLTIRAWMYHLFYAIVAAAALGLIVRVRNSAVAWCAAFYFLFLGGQLYQAAMLSIASGVAAAMGWHTYAVAGAEIALALAGIRAILPERAREFAVPAGVALFAMLDVYTVNAVAVPYYTGLISHKANGALAALRVSQLPELAGAFGRLSIFKSAIAGPAVIVPLWVAYLAATVFLVGLSLRLPREVEVKGMEARVTGPSQPTDDPRPQP